MAPLLIILANRRHYHCPQDAAIWLLRFQLIKLEQSQNTAIPLIEGGGWKISGTYRSLATLFFKLYKTENIFDMIWYACLLLSFVYCPDQQYLHQSSIHMRLVSKLHFLFLRPALISVLGWICFHDDCQQFLHQTGLLMLFCFPSHCLILCIWRVATVWGWLPQLRRRSLTETKTKG